ncbi:MAG TPA: PVC-type heme-binding CxxCH protein [Planctomycetota bacterium]|nr:PVC-type heme-binding CxxCH protein [Planctomycetota bacterium]
MLKRALLFSLLCSLLTVCAGENPFAAGVRTTPALTPEQEAKTFHLPPGFEIQLVAAEPDISKPMNLAFDAKGRLWMTQSQEYPFPVKGDAKGKDKVMVLEDFGPDGKARKITCFADGLNIPIGLYPFHGGCVVMSIPNVWLFQDTDNDGVADKREILYGPIGYEKDTHGMISSFQRGFDGWLYATHGFNNTTTLKGKDGSSITMNSGNTFRVRLDGSRVEQHTWGQVNPFGLAFDPLGNLYSADCHSSPIYQLLRGSYYPSFGKPHDGLGFGPTMLNHSHGSTAIGGIVYYADDKFPEEFRGNVFCGNPMTCRINRDKLEDRGTTRIAKEMPDLLKCDDPWFRPVNMCLGPDGAIYVADFYNRIIGHYEVPLTHPGRDRERGRVWRIVYKGENAGETKAPDLSAASTADLITALGNSNLSVRTLASNQLTDRIGKPAADDVKKKLRSDANAWQKLHGIWILHRFGTLDADLLAAAAKDASREVRTHAMRVLSETDAINADQRALLFAGLKDADAFVQRAAADALGRHPHGDNVAPLLELRKRIPADDTHHLHTVRMALRNQLRPAGGNTDVITQFKSQPFSEEDSRVLADIALAVQSPESAAFVMKHLRSFNESRDKMAAYLKHASRFLPQSDVEGLAAFVREKFPADDDLQIALFKSMQEGMAQRGGEFTGAVRTWAAELAGKVLAAKEAPASAWSFTPLEGAKNATNPWETQKRASADGNKDAVFLSSLPKSEQHTGTLRSKTFALPAKLSFYLAGHNGVPPKDHPPKNFVRLRDSANGELLMEALPPRNDTAQKVEWDLAKFTGRSGFIELVDGDTATAYAWLAAGRFEPAVVEMPRDVSDAASTRLMAIDIARTLKLSQYETQLRAMLTDRANDNDTRAAVAKALLAINATSTPAIATILSDASESSGLREKTAQALADSNTAEARAALAEALNKAPASLQTKYALSLAATPEGAAALMANIEAGKASARLLQDRKIKERLEGAKLPNLGERMAKMTKGLAAVDAELQKLIDKRRNEFDSAKASAAKGQAVFTKACAVCHKIDNQGATIGPQLDGVGSRGLERIVEDILDPNRSVDPAFRYSVVQLNDGRIVNGLLRREEGELLVFADTTGKESSVPKAEIKSKKESAFSLMPDNMGEVLSQEDFNDLVAFLLTKIAK